MSKVFKDIGLDYFIKKSRIACRPVIHSMPVFILDMTRTFLKAKILKMNQSIILQKYSWNSKIERRN